MASNVLGPLFASVAFTRAHVDQTVTTPWLRASVPRYDGTALSLYICVSLSGLSGSAVLRWDGGQQSVGLRGHQTPRGPRWVWVCPVTSSRVASVYLTMDGDRWMSREALGALRPRTMRNDDLADLSIHLQALGADPFNVWGPIPDKPERMNQAAYDRRVARVLYIRQRMAGPPGVLRGLLAPRTNDAQPTRKRSKPE